MISSMTSLTVRPSISYSGLKNQSMFQHGGSHGFNIIRGRKITAVNRSKCPAGEQQGLGCPRTGTDQDTLMRPGFAHNIDDVCQQFVLDQYRFKALAQFPNTSGDMIGFTPPSIRTFSGASFPSIRSARANSSSRSGRSMVIFKRKTIFLGFR